MSCGADAPDIIALETRIAIYGYAVCSAVLGFFTWFSTGVRKDISNEEDETEYAAKVVKHIKDVDQSVMTLMLTGIALIVTSVIHQRAFHAFGLFHSYIVLLLLWVISLTGMWFIIHSWVFDILRKKKRRMATFSFWRRIIFESKWFTVHLCLTGGYGIYVTLTRDSFPPPHCVPQFFQDKVWSLMLYGFAAFPIVNSAMLFVVTSTIVWIFSVVYALCTRKGWDGQVDPLVFCIFWLLEYAIMVIGLVITIETEVKYHTLGTKQGWPFGGTLAIVLTTIPLRIVIMRAWRIVFGRRNDAKRLTSASESRLLYHPELHSRESSQQSYYKRRIPSI